VLNEKLFAFIQLIRPFEWTKSLGNMLLAAIAAMFYTQTMVASIENIILFALAFIAVGPLLWGGLYALNDWTDREKDKLHAVKKERPIPSGRISANEGLIVALSFIILSLLISWQLNFLLFVCVIIMLINQSLYTLRPFKFKEKPVVHFISGSLVNPTFRFYSGWVLFLPAFNAPLLFLLFILGLQFGGYTLYRMSGTEVEKKLGYKSSVVLFPQKLVKAVSYLALVAGCLSFVLLTLTESFFPFLKWLGFLPWPFLLYGLLMVLPAPIYYRAARNPQGIDIKFMYNFLYLHYLFFIIGFMFMFALLDWLKWF
jgi:4-hydroxybenzoate polyprenyltransferase